MATRLEARMVGYKDRGQLADRQSSRRQGILERQSQSRRDLTQHLRLLKTKDSSPDDDGHSGSGRPVSAATKDSSKKKKAFRPWRDAPVCLPEWLVDPPDDLSSEWLVVPRPDGKRCLVVACNGETTVRARNGWQLRKPFQSRLPGGSTSSASEMSNVTTVIDCVLPDPTYFPLEATTLFVLDVMCWNDFMMYDCTAEFRFFWLDSKLSEIEASNCGPGHEIRFVPLPHYPADENGLQMAYAHSANSEGSFVQDGIVLYNKLGHYSLGMTPLVLIWKDSSCSLHWLETCPEPPPTDIAPQDLALVVALRVVDHEGSLGTCDVPTTLCGNINHTGVIPPEFEISRGQIYRFVVLNPAELAAGVAEESAADAVELEFFGKSSFTRGQADSWSRIIFQSRARHYPLTFQTLIDAARRSLT